MTRAGGSGLGQQLLDDHFRLLVFAPLEALIGRLGDERWLLIMDSLEQVVSAAADLSRLLARCPAR